MKKKLQKIFLIFTVSLCVLFSTAQAASPPSAGLNPEEIYNSLKAHLEFIDENGGCTKIQFPNLDSMEGGRILTGAIYRIYSENPELFVWMDCDVEDLTAGFVEIPDADSQSTVVLFLVRESYQDQSIPETETEIIQGRTVPVRRYTVAKRSGTLPAYSGPVSSPCVALKKGTQVILKEQAIHQETVEYGYSDSALEPPAVWQSSTEFSEVPVGEHWFYTRVQPSASHREKVSEGTQVSVFAPPRITGYSGALSNLTVGTAIPSISPTVRGGAGIASEDAYAMQGTLPDGLQFDPNTGTISGTPEHFFAAGSVSVTVMDREQVVSEALVLSYSAAEKTNPICTPPAPVGAVYGQTLADLTLTNPMGNTPGHWEWVDSSQPVGDVGNRQFSARFVPENPAQFFSVTEKISVSVSAKSTTISVAEIGAQVLTGNCVHPTVHVAEDGGKTLILDTDYTVKYGANNTAGPTAGTVTILAKEGGRYTFQPLTKTFEILNRLPDISILVPSPIVYDGTPVTVGTDSADVLHQYTGDGTLSVVWYADEDGNRGSHLKGAPTEAGTYWIGISASGGASCSPVKETFQQFTILRADIHAVSVTELNFPVKGAVPDTAVTVSPHITALVEWYRGNQRHIGPFMPDTVYTAQITLTPDHNHQFTESTVFQIDGLSVSAETGSQGQKILRRQFPATAAREVPRITAVPAASAIFDGQTLGDSALSNGEARCGNAVVHGIFTWADAEVQPAISDSEKTAYRVLFTPTGADADSYTPAACEVTLRVYPKMPDLLDQIIWTSPAAFSYDGTHETVSIQEFPAGFSVERYAGNRACYAGKYTASAVLRYHNVRYDMATPTFAWRIDAAEQAPAITEQANLTRGGRTLDLSTLVTGAQGTVRFSLRDAGNTGATLSGNILTSGNTLGTVTLDLSISERDVNHDGIPEYSAYTSNGAVTVTITEKELKETHISISQGGCIFGQSLPDPDYIPPSHTIHTEKFYTGTLRRGGTYNSPKKPVEAGTYMLHIACETETARYEGHSDEFTIAPLDLSSGTAELGAPLTFNGQQQTQTVSAVRLNGTEITKSCVLSGNTHTRAGKYTLVVSASAHSNYTGKFLADWAIQRKAITPTVQIVEESAEQTVVTVRDGDTILNDAEYVLLRENGTVILRPAAQGDYAFQDVILHTEPAETQDPAVSVQHLRHEAGSVGQQECALSELPQGDGTSYQTGTKLDEHHILGEVWTVDTNGVVRYTLTGLGKAGETATLPVTVCSKHGGNRVIHVVITLTEKKPTLTITNGIDLTYGQTLKLTASEDTVLYTVTSGTGSATLDGNLLIPTRAGIVTVTATGGPDHTIVSDPVTITIQKATPDGTPSYTEVTEEGKTLADVHLDLGTISVPGTVQWVDAYGVPLPLTTMVFPDSQYTWKFTPEDTWNYQTRTGTACLYAEKAETESPNTENNPAETADTEAVEKEDGSSVSTVVREDGTIVLTETDANGRTTKTEQRPDGSAVIQITEKNGSSSLTVMDWFGNAKTKVHLSEQAISEANLQHVPIRLPMPPAEVFGETAPQIMIDLDAVSHVPVLIPLDYPTSGDTAVQLRQNGTRETIRKSVVTEDGLCVLLENSAILEIREELCQFADTYGHWAEDAISFVTSRELFHGTSATCFSPDRGMTRGMLVQVLHNLSQNPVSGKAHTFHDVHADTWCKDAVSWAAEQGIVTGYRNGNFGVNQRITREQMAVMLYRYAKKLGVAKPVTTGSLHYSDAAQVSDYAREAMNWCTNIGILKGKTGGILDPHDIATRAQVAVVMQRFVSVIMQ